MEYDVRKGHYATIEGDGLKNIMIECFGGAQEKEGTLTTSYGAITRLDAKVISSSKLDVSANMDKAAATDVQAETIRRWNLFLERATGFTSKERGKRLQKRAKDGKL
jgi:hypothetical protein